MLYASISHIAWIIVVCIQAIVHFWIFKGSRRRDDIELVNPSKYETNGNIDADEETRSRRRCGLGRSDDCVPPMVLHAQVSEDEKEEEPEQETFDGDEPQLFFELLDLTGSEMMKSFSSLENLIHEQLVDVDAVVIPQSIRSVKEAVAG